MKSIKEKALDIYPKMSRISEPHGIIPACNKSYYLGDANEEKREGFEVGANYVISCIEKEMLSCKEFSQKQLSLIIQFCEQLEATNKV